MFRDLPQAWIEFSEWSWERLLPFANDLLQREVRADTLDGWLRDWSQLARLIAESFNRLYVRTTTHTNDEDGQAHFRKYSEEVMPRARAFEQQMKMKLIESGLQPDHFESPLRKMRVDAEIFREENLALLTERERLETEVIALTGARSMDWYGRRLNQAQIVAKLTEADRGIRKRAWKALAACLAAQRTDTDRLWGKLLDLRTRMARIAGFDNYRSYRWQELGRFYYTPYDCKAFHAAIQEVVVPAVTRLSESRKRRMRIDRLRVWDDFWFMRPDPLGRPALRPFQSVKQLTTAMAEVFAGVDPTLGGYYRRLRDEGLLDLEARPHKATGGYMQELPASKGAFIFATAVGVNLDVLVQLHESGHAFHVFESANWPYHYQSMLEYMPVEFIELASMSMELLGTPHLTIDRGGLYSEPDLARMRIEQLAAILELWPYIAVVDAFQHWVYENPEAAHDTDECDEVWASLLRLFLPHLDWSGIEHTLQLCWRLQDHILLYPFYYIEYGIAQLGAVQVWANALKDPSAAIRSYRAALSLGNTATLPDLYKAAGVKFEFGVDSLVQAVQLIERTISELEMV